MKKYTKRIFVLFLTAMLVLTLLPSGFGVDKVEAANSDDKFYDSNNVIKYDFGDKYGEYKINSGAILVPEKEGTYPVLFVVHGSGGYSEERTSKLYSGLAYIMNKAVKNGYIEPMIIVMPTIPPAKQPGYGGLQDFREYTSKGLCSKVVNAIKDGTLGNYVEKDKWNSSIASRIDGNAPMSIMGYSMGGSVALHVGCTLRNDDNTHTFINVGACSPSAFFYHRVWDPDIGGYKIDPDSFVTDPSKMIYSNDSKGHFWVSRGEVEAAEYVNSVDDIKIAFKETETYNKFI